MSDVCIVVTTCAAAADARRLARHVLEARLAACAQISEISSVYRWKGEIREEPEQLIVFKTLRAAWDQVEAAIRAAHPYETPEILAWDADEAHGPYRDWIATVLTEGK